MFLATCNKLQFPEESLPVLLAALNKIEEDPHCAQAVSEAGKRFVTIDGGDPMELLLPIAEKTGIPAATVTMVTLLRAIPLLQQLYQAKGVDEAIMWDTLIDLTCKLNENHTTSGIWGTDAVGWYQRLFTMRILKLGRLEYEPIGYRWDTPYGTVAKDCPVLNVHIPSCGSLPMEDVMDSLKKAHAFWRDTMGDVIPFVCASWMLYPPMCEQVFPKDSNLYHFYRCFDTVEQYSDPTNKHFWRIFGMGYAPEVLDQAPADTSLRRKLLAYLRAGNDMGIGRSAFLFDGEAILVTPRF